MKADSEMENAEEERWAPIPGYEGVYSASTWGRVRRDAGGPGAKAGRILKPKREHNGRLSVLLSRGGRYHNFRIHRLVMLAFVGPCPNGLEVCHNDGDPSNNKINNLRYDTRRENRLDCHRHGVRVGRQVLSMAEVAEIRLLLDTGHPQNLLARRFGVHKTTISDIKTGRRWSHRLDQTLAA